ncbi:hypothetical protein NKDENANG_02543 [Candidatus Entotheonellaceae bacterium PAL068K]
MEDVRVCRFCGHIAPENSTGSCKNCGLFWGLIVVPRPEAERIARRQWQRLWRSRLLRLIVVLTLVAGMTVWTVRVFFDRGLGSPRATTSVSASIWPHTWGQVRRTPQNIGFIPDAAPFPHHVQWTYRTSVQWDFKTEGRITGSPIVVDDTMYVVSHDGTLYAVTRLE